MVVESPRLGEVTHEKNYIEMFSMQTRNTNHKAYYWGHLMISLACHENVARMLPDKESSEHHLGWEVSRVPTISISAGLVA